MVFFDFRFLYRHSAKGDHARDQVHDGHGDGAQYHKHCERARNDSGNQFSIHFAFLSAVMGGALVNSELLANQRHAGSGDLGLLVSLAVLHVKLYGGQRLTLLERHERDTGRGTGVLLRDQ